MREKYWEYVLNCGEETENQYSSWEEAYLDADRKFDEDRSMDDEATDCEATLILTEYTLDDNDEPYESKTSNHTISWFKEI